MSLPATLRFVYNHGSGQVITRGKKIFYNRGVSLLDIDHHLEQVRFRVKNDLYQNFYTVTVSKFLQPEEMTVRCQCPYNMGEICRHEVAALFHLNDLVLSGFFQNSKVTYDQKHTTIRMRDVNLQMLKLFGGGYMMQEAETMQQAKAVHISFAKNEKVIATVKDGTKNFDVQILMNEDRYFDTSCGCDETEHPVCVHKFAVFIALHEQQGAIFFRTIQNWDDQKNKLLRLYGYSLLDDLEGKFDFTYEDGKPFLRVLDPTIKKVDAAPHVALSNYAKKELVATTTETLEEVRSIGVVLNTADTHYPYISVQLVLANIDDELGTPIGAVETVQLQKFLNIDAFTSIEQEWIQVARKLQPEEIIKFLRKTLPFGDFISGTEVLTKVPVDTELVAPLWEYVLPKYQTLFNKGELHNRFFTVAPGKEMSSKTISPIKLSHEKALPQIIVKKARSNYKVSLEWLIDGTLYEATDVRMINAALLEVDGVYHTIQQANHLSIIECFLPDGTLTISKDEWNVFLEQNLVPWRRHIEIAFDDTIQQVIDTPKPKFRLLMFEQADSLHLKPSFEYGDIIANMGDAVQLIQAKEGKVLVLDRDTIAETEFCNMIKDLHEQMLYSTKEKQFYIHSKHVLKASWNEHFYDKMNAWDVQLLGKEKLKALKVNNHKAETRINISSNIDWFETTVEIAFGDQLVSIGEVKKAFARNENFVKLPDGSIGLLPDNMMQKFGLLTKMGEVDGNKLRVKKIHFSIIDELLTEVRSETLQHELESKKEKLDKIVGNDYSNINAPENLKATLRPYQLVGFQWMMFLKEAGWGGILADDMGLGKTVQTLSWLAHYKNEYPQAKFLVVCPTTLAYNWEKEIQKFVPEIKAVIHHGTKRANKTGAFDDVDLIITSYGTVRSDVKMLAEIQFDYVVLDESQAIKNPKSLATKAVTLLNAKYRLALSGTPIQNNTFDLYAQMNFLNPGMLGSRDFFMNEFAVPIDKFQEQIAKDQLKKLVYPFMLRRTKDQVASDLPPKTESILYCEMGKEQRKIYEAYRSSFQSKILGMIDEQGMHKSQFHILQGLTRLRQICDSPAIINDAEKFENHSVKLDELTRELLENTGEHKALVFSQFLGMLSIIKEALTKAGIPFVYFDGSTTTADREKAIQEFQENEACKVFLISLKAGGVGLNLTAADYVYIVDPWWNPAVEQQAIDRTHRIGQQKSVFAYRFICKDTIEEKMLVLQERKRLLAEDLISEDSAIMKRLTREDVIYLFS